MAEPKLRRDVFVALAAVAWADGELDADEARMLAGLRERAGTPPGAAARTTS